MKNFERKRLDNVDFIRAICACGIVLFHYSIHSNIDYAILVRFANGSYGDLFVTVFFILSGAMLYFNNDKKVSKRLFFWKRFKSIFPMFYLVFFLAFFYKLVFYKTIYYNGLVQLWTIILTVFGVDGYFLYIVPNFYILGEWFLGAIIILYLIYPFLLWVIKNKFTMFVLLISVFFIPIMFNDFFKIDEFRNLFSCIFSFVVGIFFIQNKRLLDNKGFFLSALLMFSALLFTPIHINSYYTVHLSGGLLFIILWNVGKIVVQNDNIRICIHYLSKWSYAIFLLHHVIIGAMLSIIRPISIWEYYIEFICIFAEIIILSALIYRMNKIILKSNCIISLDDYMNKKYNIDEERL